ncbi:hypothetical protein GGX14DRAFT_410872 [Mycena pura]|uniref:Secreted protein n=1 Tax=Mycena pura TaxID=153505 RepID=A0AAD6YVC0_9AGAR|nr:hypothetical protein GGX14DRAFT_410872 [Mycena pura]
MGPHPLMLLLLLLLLVLLRLLRARRWTRRWRRSIKLLRLRMRVCIRRRRRGVRMRSPRALCPLLMLVLGLRRWRGLGLGLGGGRRAGRHIRGARACSVLLVLLLLDGVMCGLLGGRSRVCAYRALRLVGRLSRVSIVVIRHRRDLRRNKEILCQHDNAEAILCSAESGSRHQPTNTASGPTPKGMALQVDISLSVG